MAYSIFPFLAKWYRLGNALPCNELTYSVSQRTCLPQPGGKSMSVIRKSFKILAPGNSLQRRTAYSLALVRLILAPVIFLAIYYLFRMGWIVDRIVSVDAPAATMAQQASIQMLEARRAERNYFLLHDPSYLEANRKALAQLKTILQNIKELQPEEAGAVQRALDETIHYSEQFEIAAEHIAEPGQEATERVREV